MGENALDFNQENHVITDDLFTIFKELFDRGMIDKDEFYECNKLTVEKTYEQ